MAQSGQRKCLCCKVFFDPDHRNRERQRYCSQPECRRASKTASQAAWLAQSDNHDYFRGPVHVARVQAWRAAHPGYGRGKRREPTPLQDGLFAQVNDSIEESVIRGESADTAALQDLLIAPSNSPSPMLVGLIAHLFEVTLQEDIAATTRRLVQLGHDVIKRSRDEDMQRAAASSRPSLRSVWPSSITPPSLVMLPPSKQPSTTRRPTRPKSILLVPISSVQFGVGGPQL